MLFKRNRGGLNKLQDHYSRLALLKSGNDQKLTRLQGTCTFLALIQSFCKLLDTIPQDQAFTQLIVSQIVAYYNKCYEWYRCMDIVPTIAKSC